MTYRSLLLAGLMLLGACAHRGDPPLPTCDGSARRPANPNGSVLASQTAPPSVPEATPSDAGGCR